MAYQLGQQIEMLSKYSNVDLLYGPYQDKKAACDNIPKATRDFGRTVLILENGEYKEYWWKDGIEDNNLVLKISATVGDVQLVQGKDTIGIVKNGSDVEESKGYTPCPIIEGVPYFKDIIRLDETNAINTLADDDLGFNLNIIPNIEFIWVGQFQYWDDGFFNTLVPNTVYIKYFNDITKNYAYEVKQYLNNPIIPSINQIHLIPEHLRFIGMTVIINDTKEEYWFKDGVKNENLVKKTYNANDGTLTLKVGDNEKTFSANQSTNEQFEIKASDLGLVDVMRFIGTAVKTPPTIGEYKSFNNPVDNTYYYVQITYSGTAKAIPAKIGDVFMYNNKEFACIANGDENDPSMAMDVIELGDTITHPLTSKNKPGLVKAGEEITDTSGYTPVSFKDGVPYYKDIKIIDDTFFKEIPNDNYKVYSLNLSNNTFFIYNGNSIKYINNSGIIDDIQICIPNIIYLFKDNIITRMTDLYGFKTNRSPYAPKIIDCVYKYNYITGDSILYALQNLANFNALKPGDTIFIIFEYRAANSTDELNLENIAAKNNIVYRSDNLDDGTYTINDRKITIYNASNVNKLFFTGSASYGDIITFRLTLSDIDTLYFNIDDYQNKELIKSINVQNESTSVELITTSTKINYIGRGVGHILYIKDVQFVNSQILLYNNTSQTDNADISFIINADNNMKITVGYGKYELLHITYIDNKLFIRHKNNEYQTELWNQ